MTFNFSVQAIDQIVSLMQRFSKPPCPPSQSKKFKDVLNKLTNNNLFLPCLLLTVFARTCFHILPKSRPGGSTRYLRGVGVDSPSCTKSVSHSVSATSILTVAQASATFIRNACISISNQDLNFCNPKMNWKCTFYKPQGNFLCPLYCFPRKRIIGQVLIDSYQLPSWTYYTQKYK
jgi:hypothetical protein